MRALHLAARCWLAIWLGVTIHGAAGQAFGQLRRSAPSSTHPEVPQGALVLTERMLQEYIHIAPALTGAAEPTVRDAIKGKALSYEAYQYITREVERLAAEHRRRAALRDALEPKLAPTPEEIGRLERSYRNPRTIRGWATSNGA